MATMGAAFEESNHSKLNRIATALLAEDTNATAPTVVENILKNHVDLVAAWTRDKLMLLVRVLIPKAVDPRQEVFHFFKEDLSDRLPLESEREGKKSVKLGDATITLLRESIRVIERRHQNRKNPKAERLQALVNAMEPFSLVDHGLTVAGYAERAKAGEAPPKPSHKREREQQSEIAKRRWATIPRKRRLEIAAKREETKKRRRGK